MPATAQKKALFRKCAAPVHLHIPVYHANKASMPCFSLALICGLTPLPPVAGMARSHGYSPAWRQILSLSGWRPPFVVLVLSNAVRTRHLAVAKK